MFTVFRHSFIRSRGSIIGWGVSLFLLGMMMVSFYDVIVEQEEQFQQLLEVYPPEMMAFFGDFTTFTTPEGYLGVEYFSYMPLILGIFAVLAGSGLLAADEESGSLDLVLSYPVSRRALFFGRLLALIAATIAILAVSWLGLVLPAGGTSLGLSGGEIGLPFVSLLAVLLVFEALALALSFALPSRRLAAMTSGILLVASFFVTGLARLSDKLETVVRLSPLKYYQSGDAINGLNENWLAGLLITALFFTVLAWWRFERRDIRVGGEGGWQWPLRRRKAAV